MNSIPLISNVPGVNFSMNRGNTSPEVQMRQEINTSLVALKKEAGTLEGLISEALQILDEVNNRIATLENDTVKKSDIVDVVQSGNMSAVTSNAVANSNAMPVDTVASGNMHAVTSNAVSIVTMGRQFPFDGLPTNANDVINLEGNRQITYHIGEGAPSDFTNYPPVTDYSSLGGNIFLYLETIFLTASSRRIIQYCSQIYYNGSWVVGRRWRRVRVDVTWFDWVQVEYQS